MSFNLNGKLSEAKMGDERMIYFAGKRSKSTSISAFSVTLYLPKS